MIVSNNFIVGSESPRAPRVPAPTVEPTPVNFVVPNNDNIPIDAGRIIVLSQQKLDSEAAANRPLIYNPLEYVAPPPPTTEVRRDTEVVAKKKVSGQSRYMHDMLTVEKL
jgi:hypothetical protein